MRIETCPVTGVRRAGDGIFVLGITSPGIASTIRPGQFINVRVEPGNDPLLRRPFSVYRIDGSTVEIIFNVVGRGTAALSHKRGGDILDVLGPLGVPFGIAAPDYETAILIGGGLGVAPLPILTDALRPGVRAILTFIGARNAKQIVRDHLADPRIATDDGSAGFHGTVVQLAEETLSRNMPRRPKIFACGPTPMLRAVAAFAVRLDVPCEVSLEGPMGCGIGICQGCPVELAGEEKRYALMCKDGPVFDSRIIRI
ncbi:MAG: dihydroorotate dehydrogenase electron transfer subunit [Bacteroidota bacterium]